MRFHRAAPEKVVRSRKPAHPAIISVEDFTQAQLKRRGKSSGGLRTARKTGAGWAGDEAHLSVSRSYSVRDPPTVYVREEPLRDAVND